VFNVAQIEGLPAHYYAEPAAKGAKLQLIESAEKFFAATGAVIRHGGNMAYVLRSRTRRDPATRAGGVPRRGKLGRHEAHELTHWTKHPSRLESRLRRRALRRHGLRP
jgi:antirestriction protein ArdC